MGTSVSGARLPASRDAGLRPAPRLPRSRCRLRCLLTILLTRALGGPRRQRTARPSGRSLALKIATNEYLFPGDVKAQTIQVLSNIEGILTAAGATFDDVVILRVYLASCDDFASMNDAYGDFIQPRVPSGVLPGRTTVIAGLPREEMLVEIDALAMLD